MNHTKFRNMIQLSLYGELSQNEQGKLNQHLATCRRCQGEYESLKKFHAAMASFKPVSVSDRDLIDARRSLHISLGSAGETESWIERLIDFVVRPLVPQYRTVVVAAATLAIGVGLGYYFFASPVATQNGFIRMASETDQSAFDQGEAQVSNFRIVNKNEATGDVEFQFDATTPVHVRGNVRSDERVQKILARAAVSAENPGTRLRAVTTMAEHASAEQPITNDVKTALISVVKYDENRGVRQEALKGLEQFLPDPDVVQAYIYVLKTEKNTGMKIAAINSLGKVRLTGQAFSDDLTNILTEKLQSDENNYIRLRAKAALQEVKQQ